MKVELPETTVEKSSEFVSREFAIGNVALIMEILRSKMYSIPIRALLQEVASNARDAHREIGKNDVPIEIKLPNSLDQSCYIRDFGPGITPDRMANVFIRYGESTKRDDNTQTGGFGLGAKSPWAYSDSFGITTWTPEKGKMIKRDYIAYIDASRIGKLDLVNISESDEPQGTKISLTVKPDDKNEFIDWSKQLFHYWQPRPNIIGIKDFAFNEVPVVLTGNNWFIEKQFESYSKKNGPMALIDGIPYPINDSALAKNPSDSKMLYGNNSYSGGNLFTYNLRLIFGVGELTLTSNRESIDYSSESTRSKLLNMFALIRKEYGAILEKQVESCETYLKAHATFYKVYNSSSIHIVDEVKWKNKKTGKEFKVSSGRISFNHFNVSKKMWVVTNDKNDCISIKKSRDINDDNIILQDEPGVPSKLKLHTYFANNPQINSVSVVKFLTYEEYEKEYKSKYHGTKDKASYDKDLEACFKKLDELYDFSNCDIVKLSQLEKAKISRGGGSNSPKKKICLVKKFKPKANSYSNLRWGEWEEATIDISAGKEYYIEYFDGKAIYDSHQIESTELELLYSALPAKSVVYGVHSRLIKKVNPSWLNIVEAFKQSVDLEVMKIQSSDPLYPIKIVEYNIRNSMLINSNAFICKMLKKIDNKHKLYDFITAVNNVKNGRHGHNLSDKIDLLSKLYEKYDLEFKYNLDEESKKMRKLYPLLFIPMNLYSNDIEDDMIDDLISYIKTK